MSSAKLVHLLSQLPRSQRRRPSKDESPYPPSEYLLLGEDAGPLDYLRFGAGGDFYDADSEEFRYDGWEVSGGFGLTLPFDTELTALYRYVRRNYKGKSQVDSGTGFQPLTSRDDHIQLIFLDLGKDIGDHWRVSLSSSASFNSSDVGVFDYNRFVAGGYVAYRF